MELFLVLRGRNLNIVYRGYPEMIKNKLEVSEK
jgi:hypothetical protein